MARKNRRADTYTPLDLTPDDLRPPPSRAERIERQAEARARRAVDWTICLVPGCGSSITAGRGSTSTDSRRRNSSMELPLCFDHAVAAWRMTSQRYGHLPEFVEVVADVNARVAEREARIHQQERADHLARQDGDIYFIRLNDLVKVGWTRNLAKRLKAYGASAELLACYPATRDDETYLHRQLTPARARGREWYDDGDLIQRFIDEALAKYGTPPKFNLWTQPKTIVAGKRVGRGRR